MGFFAEIASETRKGMAQPPTPVKRTDAVPPPSPTPEPKPAPPTAAPEIPAAPPAPVLTTQPTPAESAPAPVAPAAPPATTQAPEPPTIDLTSGAEAADEAERRKAHEAAEAKRKAEFDTKQAEKDAKRKAALDKIKAMNDAELLTAAVGRVATDTERLTRRNMKEAVAEHIQSKCREDAAFALLVMDPAKSMINCFQYINRKAQEYAEQEMEDQGIQRTGVYGLDVPDGLCYQWAEDYFNDSDAKEDHKDDEKFIPKPYVPAGRKTSKAKAEKKSEKKKSAAEKPANAPEHTMEQISLM